MRRSTATLIVMARLALAGLMAGAAATGLSQEPVTLPVPNLQEPLPPPPVLVEPMVPLDAPVEAVSGGVECPPNCTPCDSGPIRRTWRYSLKPWLQDSHWGYANEFHERPFGTFVRAAVSTQVQNGMAAQMTLYHMDFATPDGMRGARLNARGLERLTKIAHLASSGPFPVVIEPDEQNPLLNDARRQVVLGQFRLWGVPIVEEQVVIARPLARGLSGEEGAEIHRNLLEVTRTGYLRSFGGGLSGAGSVDSSTTNSTFPGY